MSDSNQSLKHQNQLRVLSFLTFYGSFGFIFYGLIYHLRYGFEFIGYYNGFVGFGLLAIRFYLLKSQKLKLCRNLAISFTYISLVIINYVLGAHNSPTLIWLLVTLIGALYLYNKQETYYWTAATLAATPIMYITKVLLGGKYIYFMNLEDFQEIYALSIFCFTSYAIIFLLYFQSSYVDLLKGLERSKEKAKGMLRIIEHDLANPLTVNMAYIGLLAKKYPNDQAIHKCLRSTDKMGKILQSVRELDLIESGKKELELKEVDLKEVFDQAIDIIENKLNNKEIELVYEGDWERNLKILAHQDLLSYQVIGNLLTNAIKFSDAKSKVTITCLDKEKYVEVSIMDQGIGIPEELQKLIFNPYAQTNRKGTAGELGSGFGLPIVKSSLELMQAQISLESSVLPGQSFTKFIIHFVKK